MLQCQNSLFPWKGFSIILFCYHTICLPVVLSESQALSQASLHRSQAPVHKKVGIDRLNQADRSWRYQLVPSGLWNENVAIKPLWRSISSQRSVMIFLGLWGGQADHVPLRSLVPSSRSPQVWFSCKILNLNHPGNSNLAQSGSLDAISWQASR